MEKSNSEIYAVGGTTKDDSYLVYWLLGNYCTYSCSYCPKGCHSGTNPYHPLSYIIKGMKKFPEYSTIIFGGGEPTYHPDFEKILENKPTNCNLGIISNGARPYSFWERIVDKLSTIILSYHIEFANFDRFAETAKFIYKLKNISGRINFPMHPKHFNECLTIYKKFLLLNLPVIAKPIVDDFGPLTKETKIISDYSESQLKIITDLNKNFKEHKNIKFYDKNNQIKYEISASELLSSGQANFKNWKCYAPYMGREILANGDVVTMGCRQRKNVGSIFTDFSVREDFVICNQSLCWCHADLHALKIKNDG